MVRVLSVASVAPAAHVSAPCTAGTAHAVGSPCTGRGWPPHELLVQRGVRKLCRRTYRCEKAGQISRKKDKGRAIRPPSSSGTNLGPSSRTPVTVSWSVVLSKKEQENGGMITKSFSGGSPPRIKQPWHPRRPAQPSRLALPCCQSPLPPPRQAQPSCGRSLVPPSVADGSPHRPSCATTIGYTRQISHVQRRNRYDTNGDGGRAANRVATPGQ